jgi:hypothetical protein
MKFIARRVEAKAWKYLVFYPCSLTNSWQIFVSLMSVKWYACCLKLILSCRSWLDRVLCSSALSSICMQCFILRSIVLRQWNLPLAHVVMSFLTLVIFEYEVYCCVWGKGYGVSCIVYYIFSIFVFQPVSFKIEMTIWLSVNSFKVEWKGGCGKR